MQRTYFVVLGVDVDAFAGSLVVVDDLLCLPVEGLKSAHFAGLVLVYRSCMDSQVFLQPSSAPSQC